MPGLAEGNERELFPGLLSEPLHRWPDRRAMLGAFGRATARAELSPENRRPQLIAGASEYLTHGLRDLYGIYLGPDCAVKTSSPGGG